MTAVLKFKSENAENTGIVDFITAGTGYVLLANGIDIPVPKTRSSMLENPGLSGERLFNKHYSNREIEIIFDIRVSSHDVLLERIRLIQQLIDKAIENSQLGHGERIYLEYKFSDASESVYFMVLDGSLSLGSIADVTAHRDKNLRENKLTLVCEPFARGALAPIQLRNLLVNPGFEWNPGESGRDSLKYLVIDANTKYLSHATSGNFKPSGSAPNFLSVGWWIKRGSTGGAGDDVIAVCGHTTPAWKLWIDGSGLINFSWWDTGGTEHTMVSITGVLALGSAPAFISVCMYSTDGTDIVAALLVNGSFGNINRVASPLAMRTPVGELRIGQLNSTNWFEGNLYNGFVLTDIAVLPFQLVDLYLYGLGHLTDGGPFTEQYWMVTSTHLKGLWLIQEPSGDILDASDNANDLTVNGSPSRIVHIRKPKGWTLGADFNASTTSGLIPGFTQLRTGAYAVLFLESTGSSTKFLEQVVDVPVGTTFLTLAIWLYKLDAGITAQIEIEWQGSIDTLTPSTVGWHQYYKTVNTGIGATSTLKIKHTAAVFSAIMIDNVQLLTGRPFGAQATWAEKSAPYLPFAGSSKNRNVFDYSGASMKTPVLDVSDIPGDVGASCRVVLENTSGQNLGPVRIGYTGAQSQPWASRYQWRLDTFIPIWANSTEIVNGALPDPGVFSRAEIILQDRIIVPLGRLFPIPHKQGGSYKTLIGVEGAQDLLSLLRLQSQMAKIPLTFDPIKDINIDTTNIHMVDTGILTWPPDAGRNLIRTRLASSLPRNPKSVQYTPKLLISNITDAEIIYPNAAYIWLILLPIDGGFAIAQPATINPEGVLLANEQLVIDTTDEESTSLGYISKFISTTGLYQTPMLIEGADLPIFTSGFYLPIGLKSESMFMGLVTRSGSGDIPFGRFVNSDVFDMWVEYIPRYLYV